MISTDKAKIRHLLSDLCLITIHDDPHFPVADLNNYSIQNGPLKSLELDIIEHVTTFVIHSSFWETDRVKELLTFYATRRLLLCSQCPAIGQQPRQFNAVHILTSYFPNINFNIVMW
jgi:hypothetical protein